MVEIEESLERYFSGNYKNTLVIFRYLWTEIKNHYHFYKTLKSHVDRISAGLSILK